MTRPRASVRGALWAALVSLAAPLGAAGAPCPRALVTGSDAALVAAVRGLSLEQGVITSTTTVPGCAPLVVQLAPDPEGVRLILQRPDGRLETRAVGSPATVAHLVAAWTTPALDDLAWEAADQPAPQAAPPASPPNAADPEFAPAGPRLGAPPPAVAPAATAEATVDPPPPAAGSPSALWVAGAGSLAQADTAGGELELGWRSAGPWTFGGRLRGGLDRQPTTDASAGALGLEAQLGGHVGYALRAGAFDLAPQAILLLSYRHLRPTAPIGPIPCAPADPCEVGDPLPDDGAPFQRLSAWVEAGAAARWAASEAWGLRLEATVGVRPLSLDVDAPPVAPAADPTTRVRDLPVAARWRVGLRLGVEWSGP